MYIDQNYQLHATPFKLNEVGGGLLVLFQRPLKPGVIEFPGASVLSLSLVTVTCDLCWVKWPFHPNITCWPAEKEKMSVQP